MEHAKNKIREKDGKKDSVGANKKSSEGTLEATVDYERLNRHKESISYCKN